MGNLSLNGRAVPVEACGVVSWGGHRANGEGGLRPSSNAEQSSTGKSLELSAQAYRLRQHCLPSPSSAAKDYPLAALLGHRTRSYWRETLAPDTQHNETFEQLPITGAIDLAHARKKFEPTWPDPIVIEE